MSDTILPASVLFVDDDRSMRVAFGNAARAMGIESVVVDSGGAALEVARARAFPVVVTDLRMPGIDGLALIERLATLDRTTTFVLVTGEPDLPGYHSRADGAIASILCKPWQPNELGQSLEQAYALHNKRRAQSSISKIPPTYSVLLVEDSNGDAELVREYLADLPGVAVEMAPRLQSALTLLHERQFELIITDLTLPDARGFDAVLRLQAGAPRAALVVYSGIEDEDLALQVVQLGAQDFLPKSRTDRVAMLRAVKFARERKQAEARLRRLAHYDQLTGLANRASFDDSLAQAVARVGRSGRMAALMMIDLDGFKAVNDTHGHEAGDRVLQEVGIRLRCLFREYDVVARFGGDEFAVLLTDFNSKDELTPIAERLLEALSRPIHLGGCAARVGGSVGLAVFPEAGGSPAQLLKAADAAMYEAKRGGRNAFRFSGPPREAKSAPSSVAQEHRSVLQIPMEGWLRAPRIPYLPGAALELTNPAEDESGALVLTLQESSGGGRPR